VPTGGLPRSRSGFYLPHRLDPFLLCGLCLCREGRRFRWTITFADSMIFALNTFLFQPGDIRSILVTTAIRQGSAWPDFLGRFNAACGLEHHYVPMAFFLCRRTTQATASCLTKQLRVFPSGPFYGVAEHHHFAVVPGTGRRNNLFSWVSRTRF